MCCLLLLSLVSSVPSSSGNIDSNHFKLMRLSESNWINLHCNPIFTCKTALKTLMMANSFDYFCVNRIMLSVHRVCTCASVELSVCCWVRSSSYLTLLWHCRPRRLPTVSRLILTSALSSDVLTCSRCFWFWHRSWPSSASSSLRPVVLSLL